MTKDEMKDKISMALKDPILQQGFEVICKENAELKEQIEQMKCCEKSPYMCEAKAKALAAEMQEKEPNADWEAMNGDKL